jgi:two-component system nitrate/nitrite response regulator NarL
MQASLSLAPKPRLVIAEDELGVASALKVTFEYAFGYDVVAVVRDGLAAMDACRKLKPAVLVADLRLPEMDGIALVREIRRRTLQIGVAILTSEFCPLRLGEAVAAGPEGFAHKSDDLSEWERAIRAARDRSQYFSRMIVKARRESGSPEMCFAHLSPAERDLLVHIAQGRTSSQIAAIRGTSERTVDNQRTSLREKLGAHCTADLVRCAMEAGLVDSTARLR